MRTILKTTSLLRPLTFATLLMGIEIFTFISGQKYGNANTDDIEEVYHPADEVGKVTTSFDPLKNA